MEHGGRLAGWHVVKQLWCRTAAGTMHVILLCREFQVGKAPAPALARPSDVIPLTVGSPGRLWPRLR